ncbi:MAG: PPC domain-containing DNA-binding protein [Patescibacteria group bacterium]
MQIIPLTDTRDLVVLAVGESFISALKEYVTRHPDTFCTVSGIGAVEELTCGYYDLTTQTYQTQTYTGPVEVASLTGNIVWHEGEPRVHAHGVFTDTNNHAFGGHIVDMQVAVTLELIVTHYSEVSVERVHDMAIGLPLLQPRAD